MQRVGNPALKVGAITSSHAVVTSGKPLNLVQNSVSFLQNRCTKSLLNKVVVIIQ